MIPNEIDCICNDSNYPTRISILYWMYANARDYERNGSLHNPDAFDDSDAHAYAFPDDYPDEYPNTDTY